MRAAHAEFLLIDNSNSFTKFALASRTALVATRKLRTRDLDSGSLSRTLRGWRFDSVVMCSVVPEKGALLATHLRAHPFLAVNARTRLGIGIEYPKPRTIGADRLANAVSATHFYGAPVVVVDFGTAVTFDIISRDRNYIGGVIAPGLRGRAGRRPSSSNEVERKSRRSGRTWVRADQRPEAGRAIAASRSRSRAS